MSVVYSMRALKKSTVQQIVDRQAGAGVVKYLKNPIV